MVTHLSVPSVCPISAALPYLTMCHSASCLWGNTCFLPEKYLQPSFDVPEAQSLLKHGRTNFLGEFLPLEIGQKMKITSKISVSAVTVVLLRKVVLPVPCQRVLRSLSACSHVVPVTGQLRHAGTEQQPQHFNTSMLGEGVSCCFSKILIHSGNQNISKCPE